MRAGYPDNIYMTMIHKNALNQPLSINITHVTGRDGALDTLVVAIDETGSDKESEEETDSVSSGFVYIMLLVLGISVTCLVLVTCSAKQIKNCWQKSFENV